jgi:transposase-like protein
MLKDHVPRKKSTNGIGKVKKLSSRRQYTEIEQLYIVQLRFNSLKDFTKPWMTFYKIGKLLKIDHSVVARVVYRFIRNDYQVRDKRKESHGIYVSPDLVQYLIDPKVLTELAPLSLIRRVAVI